MTVERLERVMWRLRKRCAGNDKPTNHDLRLAIMHECGTNPQTIRNNRKALKDLGWIKPYNRKRIRLTNKDLTGD